MIRQLQRSIFWRGSILSIALGVAVFLAITIANRGAVESFPRVCAMITGHADLEIRGRIP